MVAPLSACGFEGIEPEVLKLRESNSRFPYKSTVNIILMNSSVHMLKQSKNS